MLQTYETVPGGGGDIYWHLLACDTVLRAGWLSVSVRPAASVCLVQVTQCFNSEDHSLREETHQRAKKYVMRSVIILIPSNCFPVNNLQSVSNHLTQYV
jgi:adenosine/AMP kinase